MTDRAALPSIRALGLLSATRLCALHGLDAPASAALLDQNRPAYAALAPGVVLRRQGMPDGPLSRRLEPGLDPVAWRRLINGKVFLFARRPDADRLRAREAARDQVVLRYATADLVRAGLDLRACRTNNGYLDRRSLDRPRLRGPGDYVPASSWGAGTPREVTVEDGISAVLLFDIVLDDLPP